MNVNVRSNKDDRLSNEEVRTLIYESQQGNQEARDILVERNVRLVWSVVQRFMNRGYDPEDLFQIGSIGLIKAIDKFDLTYDVRFSTYAVPMIIGEIQRFIRDDGTVKVSRTLKELGNKVRLTKEELTKKLKRSPSVTEIANKLDITTEEVAQAQDAIKYPQSIYETVYENGGEPITLLDQLSSVSEEWFDHLTMKEAIERLLQRERLIVYMQYYKDKTKYEVER